MPPNRDSLPHVFLIRGLAGGRPFLLFRRYGCACEQAEAATGIVASVSRAGRRCSGLMVMLGAIIGAGDGGRAPARARPVLIGHSMGADAALKVAVNLAGRKDRRAAGSCVSIRQASAFYLGRRRFRLQCRTRALCFYQKVSPLGRGILKAAPDFEGTLIQERHRARCTARSTTILCCSSG